jgi:hypothetical protein
MKLKYQIVAILHNNEKEEVSPLLFFFSIRAKIRRIYAIIEIL